ncbi:MAG: ATP-binding protein, partial [Bryobacteraceae bacterium]|nr:ATP-binding protein [Bryobacteraceae bacterium]
YGQLLAHRPGSDKVPGYAAEVVKAGERAAGLTHQLLSFTRQQRVDPVLIDLNQEIRSLEKMLRRIIGEDVELILDLSPDAGHVLLDPTQLGQLVMNLAVNARDAMPAGGALRIASRHATLPDPREPVEVSTMAHGPYVVLHFTDTGTGIAPEVLARIFEPFFTTKEHGKGTGLGLSTVHGIVEQARGKVMVESSLGEGTTFAAWLPMAESPVPLAVTGKGSAGPARMNACIAVVEDDAGVRSFVTEVLRGGDYVVIEAGQPQEALALLSMYQGPVDLLLTDVVMPGMNGFDFAMRLRSVRPDIHIVFMSGYAGTGSGAELLDQGAFLLRKPFLADELLQIVSEALHQPVR